MKAVFDEFAAPEVARRKVLLGILFASAAGLAAWRQPREKLDFLGPHKLDDVVPKTIGRWKFVTVSGLIVPPEDQLAEAIYSQVLTRVYWDGKGAPVQLLIAQSGNQTGFLQIHRPETCYTASGYRISPVSPHSIKLGKKTLYANAMDAEAGGPTEHVIYWTRVGDRMPESWKAQRLATAEQNLRGINPDAILVRLSVVNNDPDEARITIDEFVRSLFSSIPPKFQPVFIA